MAQPSNIYLQFYGAANEVTGSLHRLHVDGLDILLDCGLFQGRRADSNRRNRELPNWAHSAHALVLSHAHIDHSGNIPSLVKHGFAGNIYCTACTRDLCSVMLRDSAMIQQQDARYLNRQHERAGREDRVEPLYTVADVQQAIGQMVSLGLGRDIPIAPGVTLTFHNAGHVLGSALVQLSVGHGANKRRLLFTGDLGRDELPLLQSPEIVPNTDFLLMESTYGDRLHGPYSNTDEQLGRIIRDTISRSGRVYIPTFALERAQEILFSLSRLHLGNKIPRVPVYIDSPLAISITEIYKLHPESLSSEVRDRLLSRDDPFAPQGVNYVSDVEQSKQLQASDEPCIVIAGSGMCEGGRIVFHLRHGIEKRENSLVIVGFMAEHTLGRRLVDRRKEVNILGVPRTVRANSHVLNGLSAHADRDDLIHFARETASAGHLRGIALVHGESRARERLRVALDEHGLPHVVTPDPGDRIAL